MGFFAIPTIERKPWGIICACLSLIPGLGAWVAAGYDRNWRILIHALVMLAIPVVGWVYSLVWGVMVFLKSETTAAPPEPAPKATKGRARKA